MTQIGTLLRRGFALLGLAAALLLLPGCGTTTPQFDNQNAENGENQRRTEEIFRIGDQVTISYAGPGITKEKHEERIKEDGTITPPDIGAVAAAGKSPGELQRDLQKEYDRYYQNLTVTVKSELRYYYVEGEVRKPGAQPYLGETDIVKAIASAGGFTEFARKGKIQLRRPGRPTQTVDYQDAIDEPSRNPAVYPGDTIYIPRRWL